MKKRIAVIAAALTLATILVAAGIFSGQFVSVFEKASRICLECIGIG